MLIFPWARHLACLRYCTFQIESTVNLGASKCRINSFTLLILVWKLCPKLTTVYHCMYSLIPRTLLKKGGGWGIIMHIHNSLALTWYWLMKRAMSNPSVGMVPSTDAWALSAGEEIQTACTTTVDGMTTLSEWKYWDLENGSIRSEKWKYWDLENGSIRSEKWKC